MFYRMQKYFSADPEAEIGNIFVAVKFSALKSELYAVLTEGKNRRFDINNVRWAGLLAACTGVFYIFLKISKKFLGSPRHRVSTNRDMERKGNKNFAHNQLDGKGVNSNGAIFFLG